MILGGCCNSLICSSNSSIVGGCCLSLTCESNIVYVPELKIATASNDNTLSKVLVWDDTSSFKTKWRDLSVININPKITSYTLVLGDEGGVIDINSPGYETLTIPAESSVNFSIGSQFVIVRSGIGEVTLVPDTGVTINSALTYLSLNYQYSAATLIKTGSDIWYLFGDLKA